jgi:hypothetical protein
MELLFGDENGGLMSFENDLNGVMCIIKARIG